MAAVTLRLALLLLAWTACECKQHVAILSTGRSGSTLLMELLGSLPDTVFFFEPYFNFAHHDEHVSAIPINDSVIPRMSELYDCHGIMREGRLQSIMSLFACEGTSWIAETPAEVDLCMKGVINIERSLSRCLSSSRIVLKVTKLPWLMVKLNSTGVVPQDVKVIHLVRHPAAVLKSQYSAGWDVLYPRVDLLDGPASLGAHICAEMLVTANALEQLDSANVLTVRYEDIMGQFDLVMAQVLRFLEARADAGLLVKLQHARQGQLAGIPRRADKMLTAEEAMAAVARSDVCQYVSNQYYYKHMPHSEL